MSMLIPWKVELRKKLPKSGREAVATGVWKAFENTRSKYPDWGDLDGLLDWARRLCRPAGGQIEISRKDVQMTFEWTVDQATGVMRQREVRS